MPAERVLLVRNSCVATLVLNRPEVRNALDAETVADFTRKLGEVGRDPGTRVVLVEAAGTCFSAGADLRSMRRMATADRSENLADTRRFVAMLRMLYELPKPTVALVRGAAVGGGVGLVACCDLAIASQEAVFRLSEVQLGLVPAMVGPYLVQALGPRAARRWMLTGEPVSANDALQAGLVHTVVPSAEITATANRLVGRLLRGAPGALAACKSLVHEIADRPLDDALRERTAAVLAERRSSPEGLAGVRAFLGKSRPPWVAAVDICGSDCGG